MKRTNQLLARFGYRLVKGGVDDNVEIAKAIIERDKLRAKVLRLENQVDSLKKRQPIIDPLIGDPSPKKQTERKQYVAEVAGVHKHILEPKFKQMISTAHSLLEDETNSREADQALKGATYVLWELVRWGDLMVSEQVSYQSENLSSEEDLLKEITE